MKFTITTIGMFITFVIGYILHKNGIIAHPAFFITLGIVGTSISHFIADEIERL